MLLVEVDRLVLEEKILIKCSHKPLNQVNLFEKKRWNVITGNYLTDDRPAQERLSPARWYPFFIHRHLNDATVLIHVCSHPPLSLWHSSKSEKDVQKLRLNTDISTGLFGNNYLISFLSSTTYLFNHTFRACFTEFANLFIC